HARATSGGRSAPPGPPTRTTSMTPCRSMTHKTVLVLMIPPPGARGEPGGASPSPSNMHFPHRGRPPCPNSRAKAPPEPRPTRTRLPGRRSPAFGQCFLRTLPDYSGKNAAGPRRIIREQREVGGRLGGLAEMVGGVKIALGHGNGLSNAVAVFTAGPVAT